MEEIFAEDVVKNNNFSERARLERRYKRARELQLRKNILIATLALVIFILIAFVWVQSAKAETKTAKKVKSFSSVEVKPGDTVWSIANAYMSEDYSSVSVLVDEIKKTNHISENNITAGSYIIVPYFTASK